MPSGKTELNRTH